MTPTHQDERALPGQTALATLIVVATINETAHILQMEIIAEFVEDDRSFEILREPGVDHAQGYAIAGPVPLADPAVATGGIKQTGA